MIEYRGGCHCGNLRLAYRSAVAPEATLVRACQCSFCRKHGVRTVANPEGSAEIAIADPLRLLRYRFGLGIADYLVCLGCGVYLAAVQDERRAVLVLNALEDAARFTQPARPMDYDGETAAERRARRARLWTPVELSGA